MTDLVDEIMDESVEDLKDAIVGHRIVHVNHHGNDATLVLDDGRVVEMISNGDCCAFTDVERIVVGATEHVITDVTTENGYQKWHVLAGMDEVLGIDVAWSEGTGWYMYGFTIRVKG